MTENDFQHGKDWQGQPIGGWWLTEKFDGCRVFWDGAQMWTRGGNPVAIPAEWRAALPGIPLDCELFAGYGRRAAACTAAKFGRFDSTHSLRVFDAPSALPYAARLLTAHRALWDCPFAIVAEVTPCHGADHAFGLMREIIARGGEGAVAWHPASPHAPGRGTRLLKITPPRALPFYEKEKRALLRAGKARARRAQAILG